MSLFIFFSIFDVAYAYEWTEPSGDPPAGNIDLPLNQGVTPQYKEGPLTIGGTSAQSADLFTVITGSSLFKEIEIVETLTVGEEIILDGNSEINLANGSSINLDASSINLANGSKISISYAIAGPVLYSNATHAEGVAVFGNSINGTSIFGLTQGGVAIFGSSTGGGLAGRFDGKVRFNDASIIKYVEIEDGHILVQSGFSTIPQPQFLTSENNVYRDNSVATKNLCFYNKDSDGNYLETLDCRDEFMGGPASENFFIWNVGHGSLFEDVEQTADISLDGLISVKCNGSGVQANPTKGIKVGEGSYLYDSSCDAGGGEIPDATLHMQSAETINIGSNPAIASGLVVLKVTNASNSLLTVLGSGNVGIGTTTPASKLHVNGGIYLNSITTPSPTTNRLYNTGGNLFWNGMQLNISQANHWVLDGTDLYTTSTIQRVGIGTTTPQSQLHVNGGIYLTPTTTQFAENILFNNSNGDLVWRGNMMLEGDVGPELVTSLWINSSTYIAPWQVFNSSSGQAFSGSDQEDVNGSDFCRETQYGTYVCNLAYNNVYLEQGNDYIVSFDASWTDTTGHYFGLITGDNPVYIIPMRRLIDPGRNYFIFTPTFTGDHQMGVFTYSETANIQISNFSIKAQETVGNMSVSGLYTGLGGSEGIKVNPLGQVGIGTSAPAAELHVDGDAIISGNLCLGGSCMNDLRLQCPPRMTIVKSSGSTSTRYIIYQDCDNRTFSDRVKFINPKICDSNFVCKYFMGAEYSPDISNFDNGSSKACKPLCESLGFKTRVPVPTENIDFTDDLNGNTDYPVFWCDNNECFNGGINADGIPYWTGYTPTGPDYDSYTSKLTSCTCYRKSINE